MTERYFLSLLPAKESSLLPSRSQRTGELAFESSCSSFQCCCRALILAHELLGEKVMLEAFLLSDSHYIEKKGWACLSVVCKTWNEYYAAELVLSNGYQLGLRCHSDPNPLASATFGIRSTSGPNREGSILLPLSCTVVASGHTENNGWFLRMFHTGVVQTWKTSMNPVYCRSE